MFESLHQTQVIPDFDEDEVMLEDIEVEELHPTSTETEKNEWKKRKTRVRSDVWQEYTKVMVKEGDLPVERPKAKCNRCSRRIAADPNKHGTSPLWKYYTSCVKKHEANKSQTVLNSDESGSMINWKFNQDRYDCVKMYLTRKMHLRIFSVFPPAMCGTHLNLVVERGLEEIGMLVRRVREAVKWIMASPARSEAFKDTAKLYKVETSKFLCMDVPTRWNSTYLMLESALPYAPVMALFEIVNSAFVRDLKQKTHNKKSIGVPEELDWHEVRRKCGYLKKFHKLTEEVSATSYPTCHTFFKEMCSIFTVIRRMEGHEDEDIKRMSTRMKS
ncbi:hypothetical protein SASPL_126137 [Salvia splendens]|uniref:Uncharacterized protein n=1 Tax=Salvia splendens TaxID=180675 RepID=A0A8X8ZQP4_SALSN|nr:hypothetical protein SASPL_126137 [Salvia splendens]